jgi:hypothetical protein
MKRISTFLVFILLGWTFSCGETHPKPPNLIAEQTYIMILAETQLLESFEQVYGDSIKTMAWRQVLLEKYVISEDQFNASHEYYKLDPEKQKKRIERALEIIESQMEAIKRDVTGE